MMTQTIAPAVWPGDSRSRSWPAETIRVTRPVVYESLRSIRISHSRKVCGLPCQYIIPTANPNAWLTKSFGYSKIAPASCLNETISLKQSITHVTMVPPTAYAITEPSPPARLITWPVRIKRPIPIVPDIAIP